MRDLKSKINRVAQAPGCVLVRGESGSGKELVARAIHRASPRADRPMVSVNCAAIPADLIESQLFGHKAGSFTGADRDHIGFFQQADLGTLFLDEVGELTLEGQAKLLRILEGHPFLPVGATRGSQRRCPRDRRHESEPAKVRPRKAVPRRPVLPAQRVRAASCRRSAIGATTSACWSTSFSIIFAGCTAGPTWRLTDSARGKLLAYRWPGNVRQLRNVLDSAVVLADDDAIRPHDLALRDSGSSELETLRIDEWERRLITEALTRTGDNVPEAAKLLGIGRATLYRKIEQYHIER